VEAVRHRISVANTSERIDALAAREVIPPTSHDELERVYDLLMQLRLQTQLTAIRLGQPPSGRVQLTTLGHTQQELLRLAFGQIAAIQSRIGYEYPEGG
jgi:signal-transduction protein with cAMP-binding, CBS, and nucleotidyltransferase domain